MEGFKHFKPRNIKTKYVFNPEKMKSGYIDLHFNISSKKDSLAFWLLLHKIDEDRNVMYREKTFFSGLNFDVQFIKSEETFTSYSEDLNR